jgi:formamidopyrimidine-DNA glycosylase
VYKKKNYMPELPEVEITKISLSRRILHKKVKNITILNPKLRYNLNKQNFSSLKNKVIKKIIRRSKYLLIYFHDENILLVHLGMTGRFYFTKKGQSKIDTSFYTKREIITKHDHLKFSFNDFDLIYNDIRKFGFIKKISAKNLDNVKHLNQLGPEPLNKDFNFKYFKKRIKYSNSTIKNLLMNQSVVSGLGNIYVNEALFRSSINPLRAGNLLKDLEIKKLINSIKNVLKMAIKAGGSTIKNYHNSEGKIGSYQANFKVYDRDGEACKRTCCNGKIVRKISSGRSSFFCPRCQT